MLNKNLSAMTLEELMDHMSKLERWYASARADANYADGQAYYQDMRKCDDILNAIRKVEVEIAAKVEEAIPDLAVAAAECEAR